MEISSEFLTVISVLKTTMMGPSGGESIFHDVFSRFDTISDCDSNCNSNSELFDQTFA